MAGGSQERNLMRTGICGQAGEGRGFQSPVPRGGKAGQSCPNERNKIKQSQRRKYT